MRIIPMLNQQKFVIVQTFKTKLILFTEKFKYFVKLFSYLRIKCLPFVKSGFL